MEDHELEELRRRKMAELQQGAAREEQASAMRAEVDAQKQMVLRAILEPEARERLTRVRMARPEIAEALENQLVMLYQQGRVRSKIDDETLRQFIARVTPKSRDTTIERR
jgi:programmed cell death protein 5